MVSADLPSFGGATQGPSFSFSRSFLSGKAEDTRKDQPDQLKQDSQNDSART
jgi:hypothetical protein